MSPRRIPTRQRPLKQSQEALNCLSRDVADDSHFQYGREDVRWIRVSRPVWFDEGEWLEEENPNGVVHLTSYRGLPIPMVLLDSIYARAVNLYRKDDCGTAPEQRRSVSLDGGAFDLLDEWYHATVGNEGE